MASARLLLVDDDETVRSGLQAILEAHGFDVAVAEDAKEALQQISSRRFDVLLSDLHMPGAGDGLTVISAMRQAQPDVVTLLLSAYPDMEQATTAILAQVDEVVPKPVKASAIVELIRSRLAGDPQERPAPIASVADLLEQETDAITEAWLALLANPAADASAFTRSLTLEERSEHLPEALRDIIFRLRYPQPIGTTTLFSMAALQHGARRRRQGIGVATLAEEARALQVALFDTIEKNLGRLYLGGLPQSLMAIADEVNAQLLQSLSGYENEEPQDVALTGRWGLGK